MRSVQRWIVTAGRRHVCGTALVACASVLVAACHSGVDTPVAPSATSVLEPADADSVTDTSDEVATTRGGPISFAMDEVAGSGYSGTCTLGSGGAGFRVKAGGSGTPNTMIRFVVQPTTGGRYTDVVEVDARGSFRSGGERVTFFDSGLTAQCLLIAWGASQETILAQSQPFQIP